MIATVGEILNRLRVLPPVYAVSKIGRRVTIRANTSDLQCLEKVFVEEEYSLPFDANPEFAIQPRFIVDAGANIGMATLYFAQTFPDAHVFAIEPESSNFELSW